MIEIKMVETSSEEDGIGSCEQLYGHSVNARSANGFVFMALFCHVGEKRVQFQLGWVEVEAGGTKFRFPMSLLMFM